MRNYLALILIVGYSIMAQSQEKLKKDTLENRNVNTKLTNTYIIEYDFQKGNYKSNKVKIKVNTPAAFRISNINRLAYDLKVTSKDSILAETYFMDSGLAFSSEFKQSGVVPNISIAKDSETAISVKGNDITSINDADISEKAKNTLKKEKNSKSSFEVLKSDFIQIVNSELLNSEITVLKNEKKILESSISERKKRTKNDSLNVEKKLDITNENELDEERLKNYDTLITNKEKELKKAEIATEALKKFKYDNDKFIIAFHNFKLAYNKAVKAVFYYKEIMIAADNPELSMPMYNLKFKKSFDDIVLKLPAIKDEVNTLKELYSELDILYSYLKYNPQLEEVLNYGGQVKLYAHSDYLKALAEKMNNNVKEIDFEELIKKTIQIISFLETPNAYNVTFAPVQPFNDVAVFDVKINKKEKNSSSFYNNRNFKHSEFTYGGTRIDFSLGLAASYFGNTDVYELSVKNIDSLSSIQIERKNNSLSIPSLVGLITMTYRQTGYVAFGGSAGLGIDVTDGKVQLSNFFAGPSAVFGKYERLTLTTGASIRNVGQLKAGYSVGQTVVGSADDIENYITSKYKIGFFMALTYNLSKGVKDNIKHIKTFL